MQFALGLLGIDEDTHQLREMRASIDGTGEFFNWRSFWDAFLLVQRLDVSLDDIGKKLCEKIRTRSWQGSTVGVGWPDLFPRATPPGHAPGGTGHIIMPSSSYAVEQSGSSHRLEPDAHHNEYTHGNPNTNGSVQDSDLRRRLAVTQLAPEAIVTFETFATVDATISVPVFLLHLSAAV